MSSYDSHVIEAIDNALTDYNLSCDAMRWTPDPPLQPYPRGLTIGEVNYAHLAVFGMRASELMAAMSRAAQAVNEVFRRDVLPALRQIAKALQPPPDPHHPPPLCIDGAAYHQRRKNRRRRR